MASSNAIHTAFGYTGGIEKRIPLKIGKINPTESPHFAPNIRPQSITGMCIGRRLSPISFICDVKKGKTSPIAKNIAERTIFFKLPFSKPLTS